MHHAERVNAENDSFAVAPRGMLRLCEYMIGESDPETDINREGGMEIKGIIEDRKLSTEAKIILLVVNALRTEQIWPANAEHCPQS